MDKAKIKVKHCNCCGRELAIGSDDILKEDVLSIDKAWGYFSTKDGMRDRFVVCEACYDKWIADFAIRPKRTEMTELL